MLFRSMKQRILFLLSCIFFVLPVCVQAAQKPKVLISVAPYEAVCRDLAGDAIQIELLVPAGFSSHTYEPTPKQVIACREADIWFTIGELFEEKMKAVLAKENPNLLIVDLRQGLDLLHEHSCAHHAHHDTEMAKDTDPHIWMSPKMMQKQAQEIAKALQKKGVEPKLESTLAKLAALDRQIHDILKDKKNKHILVSHPAYGYFCRDYGLQQETIEFEGKDPATRQIFDLIQQAKTEHIHTIFIQPQYSSKAASAIASQIDAKLVMLNPYAANYYDNMLAIAKAFAVGAT